MSTCTSPQLAQPAPPPHRRPPQATLTSLAAANANTASRSHAATYSHGRNVSVREEVGFDGVRQQYAAPEPAARRPTNLSSPPLAPAHFGGTVGRASPGVHAAAAQHQARDTNRSYAPSAAFPGQSRVRELNRDVVPKNMQEFEAVGRNVGPHGTANVVGGHVGRDMVRDDVTEKFTQRTFDDFKEYFNSRGPARETKGNASVYSLFDQNRIEARDLMFKNTPGRFAGAFQHDIRRPGHAQDLLAYHQGYAENPTKKNDPAMVHRQRADENPNREGLRVQYFDNYASGFETLETNRRMQHTVEQEIDHTLLHPYNTNPYTQPLMQVPFSGQNTIGLNTPFQ